MEYEEAVSFQVLLDALKRCTKGTIWKESTARYWHNRLRNTYILRKELLSEKYRISRYLWFTITEPKEREIYASYIKDRQYQHSLIDNIVYPAVIKTFIDGNCACQKGRGTKYCIDLLLRQLRKFAKVHGYEGYVLQFDIKKFFPSTNHDIASECIKGYVDQKTAKACSDVIRSFAEVEFAKLLMEHGMDKKSAHLAGHRISSCLIYGGNANIKGLTKECADAVLRRIQDGNFSGVGLGSQVTQTTQIALLNGLDHYITDTLGIKVYVRYMDDAVMVHESKEYLRTCKEKIAVFLSSLKFRLNEKTQLYPLKRGIVLLHWRIIATITGKIIVHKHRVKINRERRKLRKQRNLLLLGKMTMQNIETSFRCWQAHMLEHKCYGQILRMRRFYWNLYERRAPEWKSKRRTLKLQERKIMESMSIQEQWECCVDGMRLQ